MSCNVIGVLRCDGDLTVFSSGQSPANPDVRWLIENLTVRADVEWGIDPVEVVVITDGDYVFDIKLNGKSLGYFALRTFVDTLAGLELPELITHGPEDEIDLETLREENDYRLFVIPLFGELDNVA